MAVTYLGQGAGQVVLTNTIALAKRSGLSVGECMVAHLTTNSSSNPTVSTPAGWTLAGSSVWNSGNGGRMFAYCKIADATDVAASTFTFGGPTGGVGAMLGYIEGYGGVDPVTPTNGTSTTQSTQSGTTGNFPSMTTTVANALVVLAAIYTYSATPTGSQWPNAAPSGTTLSGNGSQASFSAGYASASFTQVTAGATGAKTVPVNGTRTATTEFAAITFALQPEISGTLAATEAKDAAALAGNVSSGALAAVEANDTASLAGNVASVGSLASTEVADVAAFAGSVASGTTGALTATEAADAAAFSASVGSSGYLSATDAKDGAAFAGAVSSTGTLAAIEAKDAAASTAGVGSAGALSATEARDAATFVGAIASVGALSVTEPPDAASFVGALAVTGALAAIEARDTASFIATSVTGTLQASESPDSASFVGFVVTPGGTYPLAIEGRPSVLVGALSGGGSVIAGSIPSTGRVIAEALKGRP